MYIFHSNCQETHPDSDRATMPSARFALPIIITIKLLTHTNLFIGT